MDQEFLVPVVIILKALRDTTDREIHERLLQGDRENTFLAAHVEVREDKTYINGKTGGSRHTRTSKRVVRADIPKFSLPPHDLFCLLFGSGKLSAPFFYIHVCIDSLIANGATARHPRVLGQQLELSVLTFFPPSCVGCSESLDAFRFFFKLLRYILYNVSMISINGAVRLRNT